MASVYLPRSLKPPTVHSWTSSSVCSPLAHPSPSSPFDACYVHPLSALYGQTGCCHPMSDIVASDRPPFASPGFVHAADGAHFCRFLMSLFPFAAPHTQAYYRKLQACCLLTRRLDLRSSGPRTRPSCAYPLTSSVS